MEQVYELIHGTTVGAAGYTLKGSETFVGAFRYLTYFLTARTLNGAPSAATLDMKLQETDQLDSTELYWTDIPTASITQITQATALPKPAKIALEPHQFGTRVRVVLTTSFTGGTAPTWTVNLSMTGKG